MSRKFSINKPQFTGQVFDSTFEFKSSYEKQRWEAIIGNKLQDIFCPAGASISFKVDKGDLFRIRVIDDAQVGLMNIWNFDQPHEYFSQSLTRHFHSSHLQVYDQLWSGFPSVRPLATFVYDTLRDYGVDEDGGAVHDVLAALSNMNCHESLEPVLKEHKVNAGSVHDGVNLFLCSGLSGDGHRYFTKRSPSKRGDYVEMIAEANLLIALSTVPSISGLEPTEAKPLGVEIFRAAPNENGNGAEVKSDGAVKM